MAGYAYERLSAQDASFLWAEQPNQPMHVGGLGVFEAAPLQLEGGGIDIERIRRAVESVLHWIPRYRQRLAWTPVEGWPVWVDDRRFDLGYHIRHIALPRPGRTEQLKELAARIHARPLDRRHALWEMWVIEGVEDHTQFAVLNKVHHCMIDGASGADLSQILMSPSPRAELGEPVPYMPRPSPSRAELLRGSLALGVERPVHLLRDLIARFGEGSPEPGMRRRITALAGMMRFMLQPASATPINGDLGPHRRLDWLTMPLEDVRELKRVLGCTLNDVVLATVSGAMRRYLFRRRVDHRRIRFRVAAPVSTRRADHDRRQGNHVSTWIVTLPVASDDPLECLRLVREQTQELRRSEASLAVDTIMQLAEWLPARVISGAIGLTEGPSNMIVTNVPGPDFPLYMVGAPMLGLHPIVPLLPGSGLGVALFSYDGKLCWGMNADHELVPDLAAFVEDVRVAFEQLRAAAVSHFVERRTGEVEQPARKPKRARALKDAPLEPAAEDGAGQAPAAGPKGGAVQERARRKSARVPRRERTVAERGVRAG